MTRIVLNEAVIARVLESANGPVALDLARRTEKVAALARQNAARIVPTAGSYIRVQYPEHPLMGLVGFDSGGSGRITGYLLSKEAREHNILEPALEEGFDSA